MRYTLKVMNKGTEAAEYVVSATGIEGLTVALGMNETVLSAQPGELVIMPIKIKANKVMANKRIHTIEVQVTANNAAGDSTSEQVKYFGYNK